MQRLDIKELKLKNFKSYGDYDTTIEMDGLGPVLILGEIDDDREKSNGSGKTTIADAIIWCLFGRLPSKDRPADNVVNRSVGRDCEVQITTKNGYVIRRTRKSEGRYNDLIIIHPDGTDISDSITKKAQEHLNKLFDLDYDIFTSSVFFTQSGSPFLELTDNKRKKALERLLHLDRFEKYVDVSKSRSAGFEGELYKHRSVVDTLDVEITRITKQIEETKEKSLKHEQDKKAKIDGLIDDLNNVDGLFEGRISGLKKELWDKKVELSKIKLVDIEKTKDDWDRYNDRRNHIKEKISKLSSITNEVDRLKSKRDDLESKLEDKPESLDDLKDRIKKAVGEFDKIVVPDINKVKAEWDEYNAAQKKNDAINNEINKINLDVASLEGRIDDELASLKAMTDSVGTECSYCGQGIGKDHIDKICKKHRGKLDELKSDVRKALDKIDLLNNELLDVPRPEVSVNEATILVESKGDKKRELVFLKESFIKAQEALKNFSENRKRINGELVDVKKDIVDKKEYLRTKTKQYNDEFDSVVGPSITLEEALERKREYDGISSEISLLESRLSGIDGEIKREKDIIRYKIDEAKKEENPYDEFIISLVESIDDIKGRASDTKDTIFGLNDRIRHVEYIRSAYSDRKKIKTFLLAGLMPYFNKRIAYYLNNLNCDYSIEFNNSMQIKSELYPYEMWSGGERKKIDLAMMMAIHDLHNSMYNQRCNVIAFDEVDGKLDADGIRRFTETIFNEFTEDKSMSVLVISHKDVMRDAFPAKIIVTKKDGFSHIKEIR